MSDIETSVSEREAEALYPTQYWEGTKTKRSFDMTTDDLQDAYMRGREAEPCAEQVEAVAAILFDKSWMLKSPVSWEEWCDIAEKDSIIAEKVKRFRDRARIILEAARKAVM